MKILLIDDDRNMLSSLEFLLNEHGYTDLILASNCKQARAALKQSVIDLCVIDYVLPDGNGVDLAKEIKKQYPNVRNIIFTAYFTDANSEDFKNEAIFAAIPKKVSKLVELLQKK
jgi:DNA-binding NtrC family response regulator